ncbi:unnamed protein product, partial [Closterium sp. NIES-54]
LCPRACTLPRADALRAQLPCPAGARAPCPCSPPCPRACALPSAPALPRAPYLATHALPTRACLRVPALPASALALPRTRTCPVPHVLPAPACPPCAARAARALPCQRSQRTLALLRERPELAHPVTRALPQPPFRRCYYCHCLPWPLSLSWRLTTTGALSCSSSGSRAYTDISGVSLLEHTSGSLQASTTPAEPAADAGETMRRHPGGGAWGTSDGGVEGPGGVEVASIGAYDSASTGADPEEALHTFLLDSGHVVASVEVATSCSCRLLMHQTLLWQNCLGHRSLPRLRSMHFRLLVSDLPRSLPPLPRLLAPPCLPRGGEHYFLMVVDDYTRYTTVFPLQSKANVRSVLIRWIRVVRRQLSGRFRQDLLVLRLHSDRGGEFFSRLLDDFCGAKGIAQSFTLPASRQQNGIIERYIGLVMEVARTSIVHAVAPHFLWPFAVRYAAEKLNLWPRVFHPETSPTLRWTGEVGDASTFWVWGSLSLVRDPPAGKLSPRTLRCAFLGFPIYAPPWQFYHPGSRHILSSQDVSFDESGPTLSVVSHVDPSPLVAPLEVSSDTSGPAEGGDPTAADIVAPRSSTRLAAPPGFPPQQPIAVDSSAIGGGDTRGADSGGAGSGGAECPTGIGGVGGTGAGDASAGVTGVGGAGGTGAGGASAGATGAVGAGAGGTGVGGAGGTGELLVLEVLELLVLEVLEPSVPPPDLAIRQVLSLPSSTGLTPPFLCPPPDQSQPHLLLRSPLPAPSPYPT